MSVSISDATIELAEKDLHAALYDYVGALISIDVDELPALEQRLIARGEILLVLKGGKP